MKMNKTLEKKIEKVWWKVGKTQERYAFWILKNTQKDMGINRSTNGCTIGWTLICKVTGWEAITKKIKGE